MRSKEEIRIKNLGRVHCKYAEVEQYDIDNCMEEYSNEQKEPLIEALKEIAIQIDKWANESVSGGWSTYQVESQRRMFNKITRLISRHETIKDNTI